jgi:hypothetical protein
MRPGSSSFTGSTCRYRASWTIRNITDWPVGIARPVYLRDADHAASIQNEESQTNDKRRRENRGMAHSVRRPHTAWVWEHADRRFRPRSYYRLVDPFPPSHALTDDEFEQAFIERPTVLYFHGNVRRPPFCQDELRSDTEDRLRTAPHLSVCGGTAHSRHSWIATSWRSTTGVSAIPLVVRAKTALCVTPELLGTMWPAMSSGWQETEGRRWKRRT